ncbi:hypothetical protein F511_40223 [Dorcoceras hygrometricum]|uniref:Uncharacterized protein n=1 Tax=Dorcoceras hygrometricum TaxID=472368 RepID=A0A2Z7CDH9_9LAMI|nr:hypothetical protein F511_40223 [Dorcoceras hygrometricum]
MASSLISNSHHIDFESVFGFDDAGMVQMFETLITTGLKEFLGCPVVFYEDALTEFFANSSVREDGMVVSTIGGTAIEISQEMFAAAFELPTEAGTDSLDVRNKLNALDAKVLLLDGQIAAIRNEQLEFQTRIAADILSLSTQLVDIVDYIRGSDAKKGEGSSSRPLSTPINQGVSSSGLGRGLSVEEAAEIVREADRQADRREREREREKRLRRLRRRGH